MFCFRLALALGKTVEELLDSISYEELIEWAAYLNLETGSSSQPTQQKQSWQEQEQIARLITIANNIGGK